MELPDTWWHADMQPLKSVHQLRSIGASVASWLLPRALDLPASRKHLASHGSDFACVFAQGCATKNQPLFLVVEFTIGERAVLVLIIHVAAQSCLT